MYTKISTPLTIRLVHFSGVQQTDADHDNIIRKRNIAFETSSSYYRDSRHSVLYEFDLIILSRADTKEF